MLHVILKLNKCFRHSLIEPLYFADEAMKA